MLSLQQQRQAGIPFTINFLYSSLFLYILANQTQYYNQMKIIAFTFLIFYSLAITHHITILGHSGDKSVVVSSNQQGNAASGPPPQFLKGCSERPKDEKYWHNLLTKTLGRKVVWITPTSTKKIYPQKWLTTYTTSFDITCPKNPVSLKIISTGVFKVYFNDVLIRGWYKAWPTISKIQLLAKCGANKLKIVVFNHQPSPSAIIYLLTQPFNLCSECKNPLTFNSKTCSCDCVQHVPCAPNNIFDKTLCKCISKCPIPQPCPVDKIWNSGSCKCVCKLATCPKPTVINLDTCRCVCLQKVQCLKGLQFDSALCQCVKSQTPPPPPASVDA